MTLEKESSTTTTPAEQRSEEWFAVRRGKVTASRIADILATIKNGNWAASRKNYAAELVTERLTGKTPEVTYMGEAIQWGVDQEPFAKEAYTKRTNDAVVEEGFVDHPTVSMSGASPDGLVGEDGLVEIKCPNTATHIETLLKEEIPEKYRLQMMWQMACTGRKWCDFVSFDPRMPEDMQVFIKRVERDDEEIKEIEQAVQEFLNEVATTVDALQAKIRTGKTDKQEF